MNLMLLPASLMLLLMLTSLTNAQQLAKFDFTPSSDIIQSGLDLWQAGVPNRLFIYKTASEGKALQVKLEGNCTMLGMNLHYKCPAADKFTTHQLMSMAARESFTGCSTNNYLPFKLTAVKPKSEFQFKLLTDDFSGFRGFNDKLEIFIEIKCTEITLKSNSLIITSFHSLAEYNKAKIQRSFMTNQFRPFIFTESAVQFMAKLNMDGRKEFDSFQFIEQEIVTEFNKAPTLMKSKMRVGGFITSQSGTCVASNPNYRAYFSNYIKDMPDLNWLKLMYLNMNDGKLHYSVNGLSKAVKDQMVGKGASIAICGVVEFLTDTFSPVNEILEVLPYTRYDHSVYKVYGTETSKCQLPTGLGTQQSVTFVSASGDSYLECPIICTSTTEFFNFKRDGSDINPDGSKTWNPQGSVEIHKSGTLLRFPASKLATAAGSYSCVAGGVTFSFNVQVIILPRFETQLPATVYAVEGESVSYSCSAGFKNVPSTKLEAQFFSSQLPGKCGKWNKADISKFNSIFGSNPVTVTNSDTSSTKTLTVNVSSVPEERGTLKSNFTHRFICYAMINETDAKKVGMPSYSLSSSSDVYFINRPAMSDFDFGKILNCSDPSLPCVAANGGKFEISLSEKMTAYLNKIGVEVIGDMRVHVGEQQEFLNEFLRDFNSEHYKLEFVNSTNTVRFTVNPIKNEEFQNKIKGIIIRPVFSFRYSKSLPSSMQMYKMKYQSDKLPKVKCVDDPLCFYSTQFDANTELKDLKLLIDFTDQANILPRFETQLPEKVDPVDGENATYASTIESTNESSNESTDMSEIKPTDETSEERELGFQSSFH